MDVDTSMKMTSEDLAQLIVEAQRRVRQTKGDAESSGALVEAVRRLLQHQHQGGFDGRLVVELWYACGSLVAVTQSAQLWEAAEHEAQWWAEQYASHWTGPVYIVSYGVLLSFRALSTDAPTDMNQALAVLERAKCGVREGSGVFCTACARLAELEYRWFCRSGELPALNRSIAQAGRAIGSGIDTEAQRAISLCAECLRRRFDVYGSKADVEAACKLFETLFEHRPPSRCAVDEVALAASCFRILGRINQSMADLDRADKLYRLAARDAEGRALAILRDALGSVLVDAFRIAHDIGLLNEAVELSNEAAEALASVDPERARVVTNFALTLLERARLQRDRLTADRAVLLCGEALVLLENSQGDAIPTLSIQGEAQILRHQLGAADALALACQSLRHAFCESLGSSMKLPSRVRLNRHEQACALSRSLCGCLLKLFELERSDNYLLEAVALGEAAKSPLLVQGILGRSLPKPGDVPESLVRSEVECLAVLANLNFSDLSHPGAPGSEWEQRTMEERRRALDSLHRAWALMEKHSESGREYVERRRDLVGLILESLKSLPPGQALVSLLDVYWPGASSPEGNAGSQDTRRCVCIQLGPFAPRIAGWVPHSSLLCASKMLQQVVAARGRGTAIESWQAPLGPLFADLADSSHCIVSLSPTSEGVSIPWHAVKPSTHPLGAYHLMVSLALRAAQPELAQQSFWNYHYHFHEGVGGELIAPRPQATGRAAVLGDPRADAIDMEREATGVAALLDCRPALHGEATTAVASESLNRCAWVHLSAHCVFEPELALEGYLELADGRISVSELVREAAAARVVVLSACSSGVARVAQGGELVSLATALLAGGVREVIATLWPVDGAAARHFMESFYSNCMDSKTSLEEALSEARQYIGKQSGWSLTYYWAPFVLFSAASGPSYFNEMFAPPPKATATGWVV